MDIHSELSFETSNWRSEDSGYHTFTQKTTECSELSNTHLNSSLFTSNINYTGQLKLDCYGKNKMLSNEDTYDQSSICRSGQVWTIESCNDSPHSRRGLKRGFQEEPCDLNDCIKTPMSAISSAINKLQFKSYRSNKVSGYNSSLRQRDLYTTNENIPTTPIKKNCRYNLKPCSPFKIKRNLVLEMHSIHCDQALLPTKTSMIKTEKINKFAPTKKVDILKLLYERNLNELIRNIFDHLSPHDIINFKSVSTLWNNIWNYAGVKQKQKEYQIFLDCARNNKENKTSTPKNRDTIINRPLADLNNIGYREQDSPSSPSENTKFNKFVEAATLDSRKQMSCVRCCEPAKVTEENSEEIWVECTSQKCYFQFCMFCKCERHPKKKCIIFDLDGPSPSKRKKNSCVVGSKKSKKNLRRLL